MKTKEYLVNQHRDVRMVPYQFLDLLRRRSADHTPLGHYVSALLRANQRWGSHCHARHCSGFSSCSQRSN